MTYQRVIPRDLFNESKLLKCLGRLALLIHDGRDADGNGTPKSLKVIHSGEGFTVSQRSSDGGLRCETVEFTARDEFLELYTSYNCKSPYPLICETEDDSLSVFNDDGSLTEEFVSYIS